MRLHDVGLVDSRDTLPTLRLCIVERVSRNTLRGLVRDELNGLHDAVHDLQALCQK